MLGEPWALHDRRPGLLSEADMHVKLYDLAGLKVTTLDVAWPAPPVLVWQGRYFRWQILRRSYHEFQPTLEETMPRNQPNPNPPQQPDPQEGEADPKAQLQAMGIDFGAIDWGRVARVLLTILQGVLDNLPKEQPSFQASNLTVGTEGFGHHSHKTSCMLTLALQLQAAQSCAEHCMHCED